MDSQPVPQVLEMPDAEVLFYPTLFNEEESSTFLKKLTAAIEWEQQQIRTPGGLVSLPRLVAWYGDPETVYSYSGITHHPHAWTPPLMQIKTRVEAVADRSFNSVLLNLYRGKQDSVSWHSDDEPELGVNPVIASVSFGATRTFQFKHKHDKQHRLNLELTSGSLLIMRGTTQHFWKHQLPKTKVACGPRINLTFRTIY